jgi:hypothetical protein
LASKAALGSAATVSSRDRPCFLSFATLSLIATRMSRNSLSSALLLTGCPWSGMMVVSLFAAAGLASHAAIVPSMLQPVD